MARWAGFAHYCEPCKRPITSDDQLKEHQASRKHKEALACSEVGESSSQGAGKGKGKGGGKKGDGKKGDGKKGSGKKGGGKKGDGKKGKGKGKEKIGWQEDHSWKQSW